jgi:hypothetical protein
MVDLERKGLERGPWRPWRTESLDWRWWLAVGVTAAVVLFASVLPMWAIDASIMGTSFDTPFWIYLIFGTWYAALALVTALVGGVRRWWLLVPAAVMVAFYLVLSLLPAIGGQWTFIAIPAALAAGAWIGRTLQHRASNRT